MSEPTDPRPSDSPAVPSRRMVLALGAAAASTVVTIRPAMAQTAGSVLNCSIPVPDVAGKHIAPDGSLVPPGTKGAFPPAGSFSGEEVRMMLTTGRAPGGVSPEAAQAYSNYIGRLQHGMSGFTCYASLQMPR